MNETWPLGAIASLKVADPKVLNNPTMHRIPTSMMVQRLKMDKEG